MRSASLAGLLLLVVACDDGAPPRPQWLVTLATDATIPALGDRVLVEIYDADGFACSSCRRAFGTADASKWPLSFGITPEAKARHVRARLFRAETLGSDGTPDTTAVIDVLGELPAEPTGVEPLTLVLSTACFGLPSDVSAGTTCDPASGQLVRAGKLHAIAEPPAAGSWPPAQEVPCTGAAPSGMVCVPGGVFILGDPVSPPHEDPLAGTLPERLVRIDPIFMDAREMTVGDYLALDRAHAGLAPPIPKGYGVGDAFDDCTFTPEAPDAMAPLSCVAKDVAESYCAVQGKRLPTEAEWEYAASNGAADDRYPWGDDDDICGHAVVARGTVSLCRNVDGGTLDRGPVAGGSADDADRWGVLDLGGNLSEWVADSFQGYGTGCWSGTTLLERPLCGDPTGISSVRGGNWDDRPISARAALRGQETAPSARIGVRCVLDAL